MTGRQRPYFLYIVIEYRKQQQATGTEHLDFCQPKVRLPFVSSQERVPSNNPRRLYKRALDLTHNVSQVQARGVLTTRT